MKIFPLLPWHLNLSGSFFIPVAHSNLSSSLHPSRSSSAAVSQIFLSQRCVSSSRYVVITHVPTHSALGNTSYKSVQCRCHLQVLWMCLYRWCTVAALGSLFIPQTIPQISLVILAEFFHPLAEFFHPLAEGSVFAVALLGHNVIPERCHHAPGSRAARTFLGLRMESESLRRLSGHLEDTWRKSLR